MNLALKKEEKQLTMTVDKFGRVVIPQEVREFFHLTPGKKLVVDRETEKELVLRVVEEEPEVVERNGWWVIRSKTPLDFDIVELIRKGREERDLKNMGLLKK